jgi:hypothetical protein
MIQAKEENAENFVTYAKLHEFFDLGVEFSREVLHFPDGNRYSYIG